MEKQKCPEVRFRKFEENWEAQPLKNIFGKIRNAFVGTATPYYVKKGNFYLESNNVKDGLINRKTQIFIDDYFYFKQKDKWLKTGDLVMVQSGHVGHAAVIPEELNNSAAHALIMFSDYKVPTNPYFLNYQLQTNNAKSAIEKFTTGNTIKHILSSDMKEFLGFFTNFDEQLKVGQFFQNLDQSIALHEKKLAQTQNFKKAMLEKMFPKHGSLRPEIRLKGFRGDWSSYSIFDLSKNSTLSNGVFNDRNKVGKGYKLINVLDMYLETSIDENRLTLLDLDKREFEQNKVNYGDIFFTRSSLVKEGIAFSNVYLGDSDDITYDGHLIKLSPNLNIIDPIFLNYCLKSSKIRKQLILGGKSTTMTTIGQQEVGSTLVDIPSIQEQKKIGLYFNKIDETLNLQYQKLQTLKNLKQAFLEKMFV